MRERRAEINRIEQFLKCLGGPSSKTEGGENLSNGEVGKVEVSRVSQVVEAVETRLAVVEGKVDGIDALQEASVVNGGGVR